MTCEIFFDKGFINNQNRVGNEILWVTQRKSCGNGSRRKLLRRRSIHDITQYFTSWHELCIQPPSVVWIPFRNTKFPSPEQPSYPRLLLWPTDNSCQRRISSLHLGACVLESIHVSMITCLGQGFMSGRSKEYLPWSGSMLDSELPWLTVRISAAFSLPVPSHPARSKNNSTSFHLRCRSFGFHSLTSFSQESF